jgi:pyruvate-formate lyase-activating enzyme
MTKVTKRPLSSPSTHASTASPSPSYPYVVYSSPSGSICEIRDWHALDFSGKPLQLRDLIPLPEGATLSMLPERLAVGHDARGERQILSASSGWALAALLPIGYTRLALPSYEKAAAETSPLPFFGYTAVAGFDGRVWVSAMATDRPERWLARNFNARRLQRLVDQRLLENPENRVLQQHAHCALDYLCPTASNLFFGRWEGAIAVSGGCNARCIGCISKQEEDALISPQDRLPFVPTVEEVVEVAVAHLKRSPDAIISFGQGCEGEPLLQARIIEKSILAIRALTSSGIININTNASNPRALQRLYDSGLDMLRASTISARPSTYDAYYRPIGYSVAQVKESLSRARDSGVFSSINLLCVPGLTDSEVELAALVEFLRETGVRLVQLRNLNIDPEVLWPRLPQDCRPGSNALGTALGMRHLVKTLAHALPGLIVGSFSHPVQRSPGGTHAAPVDGVPARAPAQPEAR